MGPDVFRVRAAASSRGEILSKLWDFGRSTLGH